MKESPLKKTIPALMDAYRAEGYPNGITPPKLAEEINKINPDAKMSQTKIWRMTSGESESPRRASLEPIADFFGVTIDQIHDTDFIQKLIGGDTEATQRAARRAEYLKRISKLESEKQDYVLEQLEATLRLAERS